MIEADDRLAGDPVWETFPYQSRQVGFLRRALSWLAVAGVIVAAWFLCPPLAVVMACLGAAYQDFRTGRHLARSIPDKAGRTVCVRFSYAWGAWKAAWIAFTLVWISVYVDMSAKNAPEPSLAFLTSLFVFLVGFTVSAAWTCLGLLAAYRSGMKVWIGTGVNQARMLLLGLLLFGFGFGMLVPMGLWIVGKLVLMRESQSYDMLLLSLLLAWFVGLFTVLPVLDWLSPKVVADRPGKFGPKVPTVGKWNS